MAAIPESEREPYIRNDWLLGLTGADDRLARTVDDWLVIGESTLLRQLTRQLPEETRVQTLSLDGDISVPHLSARVTAADVRERHPPLEGSLLVGGTYRPIDSEQGWLALHPEAAVHAGFAADERDPLAWTLDGAPVVRSVWWRSGFTYWDPSSPHDEVSEGWLVLATADAVARLRDIFPEASIAWSVTRTWRPREDDQVSDSRSGLRHA